MTATTIPTPRLTPIARAAQRRQRALDKAELARKAARDAAHRQFIAAVNKAVDAGQVTVIEAAEQAGISRQVLTEMRARYS